MIRKVVGAARSRSWWGSTVLGTLLLEVFRTAACAALHNLAIMAAWVAASSLALAGRALPFTFATAFRAALEESFFYFVVSKRT